MSVLKKQANNLVEIKKHINAIHCSNNISLVQRKIFNALLFNAYHDLPNESQYAISIKFLSELIGYDSHDRKKLKNALMGLITTAIEWNVLDHTNNDFSKWRASTIIAAAKIENGICIYEFSSIMRELLYRPDMYGRIDMHVMTRFKSGYGLALYENCIRFQGLSNTGWLSLDVFRKLMGIADDSYPVFCDFKKRVLDIALREVNQHSHLRVIPEVKRINKKVTSIRFKLSLKQDAMIHVEHFEDGSKTETIKILNDQFGLSSDCIKDLISEYGNAYTQEKIELIKNSDNFKCGKVRDLSAYLMDALKKDYKKSKTSSKLIVEIRDEEWEVKKQKEQQQEEQKQRYNKYVNDLIEQYIMSLQDREKNELLIQFEQNCDFYTLKKYKKYGLKHDPVKAIFNMFIKNNKLGKELKILKLEEFLNTTH